MRRLFLLLAVVFIIRHEIQCDKSFVLYGQYHIIGFLLEIFRIWLTSLPNRPIKFHCIGRHIDKVEGQVCRPVVFTLKGSFELAMKNCINIVNCIAIEASDCQTTVTASKYDEYFLCLSDQTVYQRDTNGCVYEIGKEGNLPRILCIMFFLE